jgi:hypothetical protein
MQVPEELKRLVATGASEFASKREWVTTLSRLLDAKCDKKEIAACAVTHNLNADDYKEVLETGLALCLLSAQYDIEALGWGNNEKIYFANGALHKSKNIRDEVHRLMSH